MRLLCPAPRSSKIRGLVSDLLERKRDHPEDKVLIFSSFPDTLKTVALALKPHGFKFRTMTSGTVRPATYICACSAELLMPLHMPARHLVIARRCRCALR